MKNNIIWVDFTAKMKSKSEPKGFFADIINSIKSKLKSSKKYNPKPKLLDNNHKSIL
ncbi:hypothetical protein NBE98_05280 [Clostridium swellfunianum]|uniref:hypothetical protein n=1 Tax=Clostridium swellfunianum TaxID=1367462 RepID=UPI0020309291|nr:hypothetical protein [Clostridium swellfunianum]MCM0647788.1 hypothetical protein [Clostridium swellfunianum]